MYALSNRAAKYMKQKLIGMKGEIDKCTTILADLNTPSQKLIEQLFGKSAKIQKNSTTPSTSRT